MSKNETTTTGGQNAKDGFSVYQQNVNKIFNSIKQSVPQYHQSVTNAQQEYFKACEHMIDSAIALEREYAKKAGIETGIPEAASKMIHNTTEEYIKAASIQNRAVLATIDATQQNIKTFNDNAKSFVELNKSIMHFWTTPFKYN